MFGGNGSHVTNYYGIDIYSGPVGQTVTYNERGD